MNRILQQCRRPYFRPAVGAGALTLLLACSDPPTAPAAFEMEIVSGDGQVAETGTILPRPLAIRVTHRGVPAEGLLIQWSVEESGGLVSSAATPSLTNSSGYATVYRTLGGSVGATTTTAAVGGTLGTAVEFTSYGQISGAVRIAPHPDDGVEQSDTVLAVLRPFRVLVTDYLGQPAPDVEVTWSTTSSTTRTDAHGVAEYVHTLPATVGSRELAASVNGLLGSPVRFKAETRAGTAVSLEAVGGNDQLGITNAMLESYRVEALDAHGNAVAGVPIDWSIVAGGGKLNPARGVTTADPTSGQHRPFSAALHRLDGSEGAVVATAIAPELPGAPQVEFTSTAVSAIVSIHTPEYWECWYYGSCTRQFMPSVLEIPAGRSVGWVWSGTCDVVFEDDPDPPVSAPVLTAGRHIRTFTEPGSYRYRCTEHSSGFSSGMVGIVEVR